MRRKAPLLFLFFAVLLAGAAAWGAQIWIKGEAKRAAASQLGLRPVVTAVRDLPAGHILEAADLAAQKWPQNTAPQGHYSAPGKLSGRVVKTPLVKGEVVLEAKLARRGLAGGLSAVVPEGYRAMTLKVDEVIGVGGFVQPGDVVDVLLTVAKGPFREDPVTRIVLQNVPVLTVGPKVQGEGDKAKKPTQAKQAVVTLKLTPAQAERLALAMLEGKVVLALRNQSDTLDPATAGVRLTALLAGRGAEKPACQNAAPGAPEKPAEKKAEAKKTVEVIKGVKRSVENI